MQSARIDDGTWLSTLENFILYWMYQHNMHWTESLRYDFFSDSELIAMLDAAVCSIKELHHVKIQCNSDGSTYDAYVSHLIDAASQYNSAPVPKTEMEIIPSTPNLLEPVLSDMDSQTDLFYFCFGDSMAHGESQLTATIDVTGRCVGPSFCEYEPFLPLYQCRYQLTQHVKLKDIQGVFSYYGSISSYGDKQSLVLWSLLDVNNDYVLVNNLYHLLAALLFYGCSVICDPRSHTDSVVDCLDHGEECTELHIECTSECTEFFIHSPVVQIKEMNHFVNAKDVDTHVLGKHHVIMAGGTTNSNNGPVILIMWQYALTSMGEFVLSLIQMEWYQVHIEDTSMKLGGKQQQKLIDGFVISLIIWCGSWCDQQPFMQLLFPANV